MDGRLLKGKAERVGYSVKMMPVSDHFVLESGLVSYLYVAICIYNLQDLV